ncbi:MAG: HAMP domain-containing histidine kinase [Leptospiraceae bacterium]|nr:HAMP domain-containing histidine kinase [Leptospiraceae bacterium]
MPIFRLLPVLFAVIGLVGCDAPGGGSDKQTQAGRCSQSWNGVGALALQQGWRYFVVRGKRQDRALISTVFNDNSWKTVSGWPLIFENIGVRNYKEGSTVYLRCQIDLVSRPPDNLAFVVKRVAFADEFYFNGNLVGATGSVDQDRSDIEKPRIYSLPGHLWQPGLNTFALRVRGLHPSAYVWTEPRLINELQARESVFRGEISQIIFSYVYILVAAFFLFFFVFSYRQVQNLFFALFCFNLGLYNLIRSSQRYLFFDSFELSWQVELLLLFSLPILFSEYYHRLLEIKRNVFFKILYGLYALLILVTIISGQNARHWTYLVNLNLGLLVLFATPLAISFYKHYKTHYSRLRFLLYGFMGLFPAILLDIAATMELHSLPRLTVYGFFFFLAAVSMQLSHSVLELYQQIDSQEKELRQLEKRRTRSMYNLSNKFNTIITGLKSWLQTALSDSSPSKKSAAKAGETLQQSVHALENLVRDSSLLVLLENQDYNRRNVVFAIDNLCQQSIQKALRVSGQPASRVTLDIQTAVREIQTDPDLIETIIYHLVENALLYTLGDIQIQLNYNAVSGLIFSVRDEGPGIEADKVATITQKFVRAHNERNIAGSGIGLSICELALQHLGGSLTIDSGGGFYSEFLCTIPVEAVQ